MNETQIISRANSINRIARRVGYQRYRADEISQDASVRLIEKKCKKQTNKQLFIDCIRGGIERTYDRRGRIVRPLFYNELKGQEEIEFGKNEPIFFEDYERDKSNIYNLVCHVSKLKKRELVIFLGYYFYGIRMGEISKYESISESRVSQILALSIERIKKKIKKSSGSCKKPRKRKQKEQREISQEVQSRSDLQKQEIAILEKIREVERLSMGEEKIKKIQEVSFSSFRVCSF